MSCERRSPARCVSSLNAVEQLLLPAECLLCPGVLGGGDRQGLVCWVGGHRGRRGRPPWCERCAQPEPHFGPCRLCSDWPAALQSVRSAFWLSEGARAAVHALKYGGLPRIADDMAAAMGRLSDPTIGSSALVPIPLAPKRLRQRGYNQSDALARALGRQWNVPVLPHLLARTRETPTQTALTPETRLANVAGACAVPHKTRPSGPGLVLVDDPFTTAATPAQAARALEQAGATRVMGITFAHAAIPDFT